MLSALEQLQQDYSK
ncbi:MbeD/MobD family mobilization/exclusion protein, partial [Salmonella enterica]